MLYEMSMSQNWKRGSNFYTALLTSPLMVQQWFYGSIYTHNYVLSENFSVTVNAGNSVITTGD